MLCSFTFTASLTSSCRANTENHWDTQGCPLVGRQQTGMPLSLMQGLSCLWHSGQILESPSGWPACFTQEASPQHGSPSTPARCSPGSTYDNSIPLWRLKQEDHEFETSLYYITKSCLKKKKMYVFKKYLAQVVAQQLGQDLCNWSPGSADNLQLNYITFTLSLSFLICT